MTQDPNARAQIEPTEVGANAAETGERELTPETSSEINDAFGSHEIGIQDLDFATLAEKGHTATKLDPLAPAVLSVDNLKMYFPVKSSGVIRRTVGHVQAVDGISFEVPKGGSLGLVGESGCGKSTTGRLITRLYKPTGGAIRFDGRDIVPLSNREMKPLRQDIQMIFQDPYSSLNPRHTVGSIVGAPLIVHNVVPKKQVLPRIQQLLEVVGLNP